MDTKKLRQKILYFLLLMLLAPIGMEARAKVKKDKQEQEVPQFPRTQQYQGRANLCHPCRMELSEREVRFRCSPIRHALRQAGQAALHRHCGATAERNNHFEKQKKRGKRLCILKNICIFLGK